MTQALTPPRILIVEDDYVVGLALESGLREAGFDVAGIATSAEEAVDIAQSARPTLAIMDIRLHGRRTGIDAAIDMFATAGTRCIFASAHHGPDIELRAARATPLGWVAKPYQINTVVVQIQRALEELRGA